MNAQRRDEQLVHGGATILADPDAGLVQRLRDGDEAAFMTLVDRHAAAMLRVASMYVPRAVAEEVVQDTWLAVLDGIDRTEPIGRPSEAPVAMLQAPGGFVRSAR